MLRVIQHNLGYYEQYSMYDEADKDIQEACMLKAAIATVQECAELRFFTGYSFKEAALAFLQFQKLDKQQRVLLEFMLF